MSTQEEKSAEEAQGGAPRWLAFVVTFAAVFGFSGLSWYAYHAGSNATSEEDVMLIEADNSPVREAPEDPGGMKVPNQDKEVFGMLASGSAAPTGDEKVAAAPEEPLPDAAAAAPTDASKQWVNEQLASAESTGKETITQSAAAPVESVASATSETASNASAPAAPSVAPTSAPVALSSTAPVPEKDINAPVVVTLDSSTPAPKATAAAEEKKVEAKPATKQVASRAPSAKELAKLKPASGGKVGTVQLGAYRSESEAHTAWAKAQKKYASLAKVKSSIVRADLGEKGVFYRLRAQVSDAKGTCASLSSKGQACMVVK